MSSAPATSSPHLWPRLYIEGGFDSHETLVLQESHSHYLRHVLRLTAGDFVRVFHPQCGEYVGRIVPEGKRECSLILEKELREPFTATGELHLFFSPLRKERLDFLIEKAVELGATHLHPVVFGRSVVREIKSERIHAQTIEAAEQCERLDVPLLLPLSEFKKAFAGWDAANPLFCALERSDFVALDEAARRREKVRGFLVGPEGGINTEESDFLLRKNFIVPVSLGPRILRAETAALFGLSLLQ